MEFWPERNDRESFSKTRLARGDSSPVATQNDLRYTGHIDDRCCYPIMLGLTNPYGFLCCFNGKV